MSGDSPRRQTQKRKYDNSHHSGHDDQPQLKRNREQPMDISPDKWVKVGLSETQSALLKSQKETRDYIMKKFNAIGLQAEIQIDYQENVMVGAFSDTDLVLADLTVRTSVADCIVPLNINSDVLKLQGWRDLCTTLLCEHQGLLLLSALPEKGLITGTSNIISSVVGQMKHFIRQNSAPKRVTDSCKSFLGNATGINQRRPQEPTTAQSPPDGGIKISIPIGDLADEKVDVIVNTTLTSFLDLEFGGVSKSLLKRAGPLLQSECKSKYPTGITTGDIAVTKGHGLDCKEVYHTTLRFYTSSTDVKPVEELMKKCLIKANNEKYRSIAFPALGTGMHLYPREKVAQAMFRTVKQFQREVPSPSLREIRVVIYYKDEEALLAFQKAERQYQRRITNPKAADEDSGTTASSPTKTTATCQPNRPTKPRTSTAPDGYTRDTRKMQRVRDYELPSHWAKHKLDETVKLVRLVRGSEEFMRVEGRFMKTAGSFPPEVECIERVQNPTLYRQYAVKRNHMDKQNKSSNNERILWHGTSDGSIQSINFDGFNRGYSGKNATVYGEGVYFAVRASYSLIDTYSPPDAHGRRYVYQCRVLVGHSTAGKFGMKVPPPRDGPIKYDSLADDPEHPSMYVILNDTQAYPEYLITLKKQKT